MEKLTLMIHIDALRHDFVAKDDMPFLYNMAESGIKAKIVPPFGFEPDGAYLTGTYPEIYEGGLHFIFNENKVRIPFIKLFPHCLDSLNIYVQYPFRRFLQYLIKKNGNTARIKKQPFIGQIPFKFLKYFYFNEELFPYEEGFGKSSLTIYDYLNNDNKSYFYASYPKIGSGAITVKKYIFDNFKGGVEFLFLMIADLDSIGHKHGPDSYERRECAKYIDRIIKDIYEYLITFYDDIDFIGFGDHGMVGVEKNVDIGLMLRKLPLIVGKDYFYFLDSTFARFWFHNSKAKRLVEDFLADLDCGSIVSQKDKDDYKINYKNRKFGDLIFWFNEGEMIFPNFWHVRNKKKGMHGYRSEVTGNHAAFIFNSSKTELGKKFGVIDMYDIFQTAYYSLFSNANNEVAEIFYKSGT